MPLTKQRDNLSDLIRKGAQKKRIMRSERKRHSIYYSGQAREMEYDEFGMPIINNNLLLKISSYFVWLLELPFIKVTRLFAILISFFILAIDSDTTAENFAEWRTAKFVLELYVNSYYVVDGSFKLLSIYAYLDIAQTLNQKLTVITYLRRSGVIDIIVAVLCFILISNSAVGRWLHLLRCALLSLFFLEQMPEIDVLMVSVSL
jgi:hypothetical protein